MTIDALYDAIREDDGGRVYGIVTTRTSSCAASPDRRIARSIVRISNFVGEHVCGELHRPSLHAVLTREQAHVLGFAQLVRIPPACRVGPGSTFRVVAATGTVPGRVPQTVPRGSGRRHGVRVFGGKWHGLVG